MPHTPNELIELIREKPISARELTRLIDEGLDPNQMLPITLFSVDSENNNLSTPLLHLITGKDNSVELAEILIAHGADIGKTDLPREQNGSGGVGNTPLLTAIAANDEALAHFLIEQCIKQNRREVLDQADISS
ncbi:MAG: ankyrin repeat domain-containing protein, partial [Methylococcales bacterium]|nr:ankyrin repeat domain-containing protein [Methylococcales bacterium]